MAMLSGRLLTVDIVRLVQLQLFGIIVLLPRICCLQSMLRQQSRHVLRVHLQGGTLKLQQEIGREGKGDIVN